MLPFIPIAAGGATIAAISKRKEARRRAAASNEFSKKYPLSDDPAEMAKLVAAAELELKTFKGLPAGTKAQRRVKTRNVETLQSWVNVMKEHNKDIMATNSPGTFMTAITEKIVVPGQPSTVQASLTQSSGDYAPPSGSSAQSTDRTVLPGSSPSLSSGMISTPEADESAGGGKDQQGLAAGTKKGVNWVLIGGVAVVGFIVYRMIKK
jgi:hypothetical protein